MNVYDIANRTIQAVNADIPMTWRLSAGYTTDPDGMRKPAYIDMAITGQVQPMSGDSLAFTEGLDIQGIMRAVWMHGNVQGVVRSDERGGDLLLFPQVPGTPVQAWKVVTVVETWPTWAHVVVVLQENDDEDGA